MPIISNTNYILGMWLKDVPEYTLIFTKLVLINGLIDSVSGPAIAPALATGNIKKFQIIVSIITFLNLPVSYIILKLGAAPTSTMIISILLSYLTIFVRAYLLKGLINLSFSKYVVLIGKISIVSLLLCLIITIMPFKSFDLVSFVAKSL
jgi:hypothetical protein